MARCQQNTYGAQFWVGDDDDGGGLRVTARDLGGGSLYTKLASQMFSGLTHGPMRIRTVDPLDGVQIWSGTIAAPVQQMKLGTIPSLGIGITFGAAGTDNLYQVAAGTLRSNSALQTNTANITGSVSYRPTMIGNIGGTENAGMQAQNQKIIVGAGIPESVVDANVGSLFLRSDGGAGTTLYIKETGTGTTGWVAK